MKISNQILNISQKNGTFLINLDIGKLKIIFLNSGLVRIRYTFEEEFSKDSSYTLVMTAWEDNLDSLLKDERMRVNPFIPKVNETKEFLELRTDEIRMMIEKQPFGISIFNQNGVCLYSDVKEKAFLKDDMGRVYHYTSLDEKDCYYGFGEKAGSLNKAGKRMRMNNIDTLGYDAENADPLYKHIPFYIKLNKENKIACGMFYNNSWQSVFDMGCERSGYWGRYSYFCADGGDIDLFFINGPSISKVVEVYTDLTGKTILPPLYSLGYMGSTMYYTELDSNSDDAIVGFADKAQCKGIPCDGFHMSSGYTTGDDGKRYVFNWNKRRFKDPEKFVRRMKEKGIELSPNVKPGMLQSHFLYNEFVENGAYIMDRDGKNPQVDRYWGGKASFVDFTNKKGRDLWKKHLKEALIKLGITAIWNDNCEYEINDPKAVCDFEGQTCYLEAIRPVIPNMMAYTAYQAVLEEWPDIRPYILNRAGFAGIQRYAQTWAGDNNTSWKSLKFNISTMLGMGLSGVANQGIDVGGFDGPAPEPELLVRWVQNAAFYPRFSIHSCNIDNTVTEPWMYPSYTKLIQSALQLRYSLILYLYSLLYLSSVKGSPVMRPLVYEFQQDLKVYDESHDFMFGPFMLIGSVCEKGIKMREVYLPKSVDWYNWYTRKKYSGGQTIVVDTPLESMPLFFRSGSIIPMIVPGLNMQKGIADKLNILIEPSCESSFTIYEDDGVSNDNKKGVFQRTDISIRRIGRNVEIGFVNDGTYTSSIKEICLEVVCEEAAPLKVNVACGVLKQYLDFGELEQQQEGFYFEPEKRTAFIKYPRPEAEYSIMICFDTKDLISI